MKTDEHNLHLFENAFSHDYGIVLSGEVLTDSFQNLARFFDLLDQFDREDRQKMKMERNTTYAT